MTQEITKLILKSHVSRENRQRQRKFLSWEQVNKIALIIGQQDALNKNLIDSFIENTKKHIEVFYIETQSKQHSYNDWHCFSKEDKSLWNLPKKKIEPELRNKKFDIVINTCNETNLFALSVYALIPAYLKCSENNALDLTDLIIQKKESVQLTKYLDETVKYLKMIKV